MKIVRNYELEKLVEKLSEKINALNEQVQGTAVPDPKAGEIWDLGCTAFILSDGKLKEPFTEIDELEISLLADNIKRICSKITKLENHNYDVYTEDYTAHNNLTDNK